MSVYLRMARRLSVLVHHQPPLNFQDYEPDVFSRMIASYAASCIYDHAWCGLMHVPMMVPYAMMVPLAIMVYNGGA